MLSFILYFNKILFNSGWKDTPITKINLKNIVRGEYDENAVRKDFTKTEAVAIWQAMESYQGQKGLPSKFDGSPERRQRAAKFLGMSTDTLSKAKQIFQFLFYLSFFLSKIIHEFFCLFYFLFI